MDDPNTIFPLIQQYLDENGFKETLKTFEKETKTVYDPNTLETGSILVNTILKSRPKPTAPIADPSIVVSTAQPILFNKELKSLKHDSNVLVVRILKDSKYVLSGSAKGTVSLWQVQTGKLISSVSADTSGILSIDIHPTNSSIILIGCLTGKVCVYHINKDSQLILLDFKQPFTRFVVRVCFSPNGLFCVCASYDHSFILFSLEKDYSLVQIDKKTLPTGIESCQFLNDNQVLLACRELDSFSRYSLDTKSIEWFLLENGIKTDQPLQCGVSCLYLTISNNRKYLGCSLDNDSVYVYQLNSESPPKKIATLYGNKTNCYSRPRMCFSDNFQYLISTSDDCTIVFWNVSNQKILKRLSGHSGIIRDVHCTDKILASASYDKSVKLWGF